MLNELEYQTFFQGYSLTDAAVRSRDTFSFLLRENQPDEGCSQDSDTGKQIRLINFFVNAEPTRRIGCGQYLGFLRSKLAVAHHPVEQAVLIDSTGEVAVLGGGKNDMEQQIEYGPDGPRRGSITCASTLFGHVYVAGPWRTIARRIGVDQWESLCADSILPKPGTRKSLEFGTDWGFRSVDGFASNDLYAAGGYGDLWRYNGHRWLQCALPSRMLLHNVCCAGDGHVYVGAQGGSVLRGREDRWEIIHEGRMTLPFKDMVWYGGRVWCTSDYGLWQIAGGELVEADVPHAVHSCAGNLSVGDGVMLLAGIYGATVFDGQRWTPVIDRLAFTKQG